MSVCSQVNPQNPQDKSTRYIQSVYHLLWIQSFYFIPQSPGTILIVADMLHEDVVSIGESQYSDMLPGLHLKQLNSAEKTEYDFFIK